MPVYKMLGYEKKYPKLAYASMLFAPTPEETGRNALDAAERGYRAVKFGWGGFGLNLEHDRASVEAIRKAVGPEMHIMVDVGTIWSGKTNEAIQRIKILEDFNVVWLEEPFESMEYPHYAELSQHCKKVKIAAGEGSHSAAMAKNMIDHAKVSFIQIDTGRIGGILPAHDIAEYALKKNVQFVNHTFTTPLALSASLQPMIGIEKFDICEFPVQPTRLAQDINRPLCVTDRNGMFELPDGDGLAIDVDLKGLAKYLVPVKIESHGKVLYESPKI